MIINPFQSILSWFKHNDVGIHSHSEISELSYKHKEKKEDPSIFYTKQFERFALENIEIWRKMIEDWVIIGDILVVHFEDVVRHRMREIERILDFLKIEKNEDKQACLKYCNVDMYKRKPMKLERSPYTAKLRSIIYDSVKKVDSILVEFGHSGIPYSKYTVD